MIAALTPALALGYLAELEPALEAVAIIGADGTTLAGDPFLAAGLAADSGALLTARSAQHTVIARARAGALAGLVLHDLEAVARDLSRPPARTP